MVAWRRAFGPVGRPRRRPGTWGGPQPPPDFQPLRPIPLWTIVAGAVLVLAAGTAALITLLAVADTARPDERAALRIDAIKAGLSVAAGAGAATALVLAVRRQWLAERSHISTEYDAAERRITELYVRAAEQLGSDKAPVRLAGLYALERLGQDHPTHRQTVTDVICAYPRMPYPTPTAPAWGAQEPRPMLARSVRSDSPRSGY